MNKIVGMLVLVLALFCFVHFGNAKVDLSCSIIVYNSNDYTKDGKNQSFCMDGVDRARSRCGGKTINFVPYAKYTYKFIRQRGGPDIPVPAKLVYDINGQPITPGKEEIDNFYSALSECMTHAVTVGFTTVAITPHLDAWNYDLWRNLLKLEPYTPYGGVTYQAIVIDPLVKAARDALAKGATQVRFALEGEMNRALVSHPASWMKLAGYVTQQLITDATWPASAVRVGVSMNWNKLCGELCNKSRPRRDTPVLRRQFGDLLKSTDFLGVSSYPSQWPTWNKDKTMDFGSSLRNIDTELQGYVGFGLLDLTKQGIQLQLSEFGIGGGQDSNAREPADSLRILASRIYAIVGGAYGDRPDPWKRDWARKFRYKFIVRALWWLNENSAPDTPPQHTSNPTQTSTPLLHTSTESASPTLASVSPAQPGPTAQDAVTEGSLGTTQTTIPPENIPAGSPGAGLILTSPTPQPSPAASPLPGPSPTTSPTALPSTLAVTSPPTSPAAVPSPLVSASPGPGPSSPAVPAEQQAVGVSGADTSPAVPAPTGSPATVNALDQALHVIETLQGVANAMDRNAVNAGRKMLDHKRKRRKRDRKRDDDNDGDSGGDNDSDSNDDNRDSNSDGGNRNNNNRRGNGSNDRNQNDGNRGNGGRNGSRDGGRNRNNGRDSNQRDGQNSDGNSSPGSADGIQTQTQGNATQPDLSRGDRRAVAKQKQLGRYPISAAFLWSMGSMDLAGVYHLSTTEKGSYYAEDVCGIIHSFNEKGELPEWD